MGRILIINPNASEHCSGGIRGAALRTAWDGVDVVVITATEGPAYVETPEDERRAAEAVLRLLAAHSADEQYAAAVIACSSDPGLSQARAQLAVPVLGIGESALVLARGLGRPYGILTNVDEDEPYMHEMARRYGLDDSLVSVRAAGHSVGDFDRGLPEAVEGLIAAGRRAVEEGARSLCLGCAAMAGLEGRIHLETGVPVFEGVASAVTLALTYVSLSRASQAGNVIQRQGASGGGGDGKSGTPRAP